MSEPPFGAFDGVYRFVTLYDLPDWLAQGWTIVFVARLFSALVQAPLPPAARTPP